jgi:hypothetical protein
MSWIIIESACCIAGEPHQPSPDPIQVSSADAKLLISQRLALPADAPVPAPAPAPVCKPRNIKSPVAEQ